MYPPALDIVWGPPHRMTAIRVYDELDRHDPWPELAGPIGQIDPAAIRADVAPEDSVRNALQRLETVRAAGVHGDDAWAESGRRVIALHLVRMLGHVPGVIAGADREDVHAMRVAGRRIRAAWRVFGDGYEADARRRLACDVRAIGARLGAVRDLDVMIEILDAYGARRSARQRTALEPLRSAWRAERGARHGALVDLLRSTTFERFVAEYADLATRDGLHARPVGSHRPATIRTRMPSTIWKDYGAVLAFDGDLAAADVATLHRIRISAKWLRYTLEFVREPMEPVATTLLRRMIALQDRLGDIHDLHEAAILAGAFGDGPASLGRVERTAIARFQVHLDARTARLQREITSSWRPIGAASYRRELGRAIARL